MAHSAYRCPKCQIMVKVGHKEADPDPSIHAPTCNSCKAVFKLVCKMDDEPMEVVPTDLIPTI